MKPPKIAGQIAVVDIPGGGPAKNGSGIFFEFEMLDGKIVLFEFAHSTAEKLVNAGQRFLYEAEKRAGKTSQMSAAGAVAIKSADMSFQFDPDGSKARIVVRGKGGPPLSIEVLPENFSHIREQLDGMERLMSEARSKKTN